MTKNYYDILGVDKQATQKEIKKKFQKEALIYHPDKWANKPENERKEAEEKFKILNEAYSVLSDEEKRKKYDWEQSGGGRMFNPFNVHSPFADFFTQRQQPVEQGTNIFLNTKVSLEDIYQEKELEVIYNQKTPCHFCNGTGAKDMKLINCPHCNGTGIITEQRIQGNMTFVNQQACPHCQGKGKYPQEQCPHCQGSGFETLRNKVKFKVPSNVINNANLVLHGYGNLPKDKNGIPGNLIIVFKIKEHDYFTVNQDLLMHIEEVPLIDCLLGCEFSVKTISGKEIKIVLPELTEDGKQFVFDEEGMWNTPYVVYIKYQMPKQLTNKQKQLLNDFKND